MVILIILVHKGTYTDCVNYAVLSVFWGNHFLRNLRLNKLFLVLDKVIGDNLSNFQSIK